MSIVTIHLEHLHLKSINTWKIVWSSAVCVLQTEMLTNMHTCIYIWAYIFSFSHTGTQIIWRDRVQTKNADKRNGWRVMTNRLAYFWNYSETLNICSVLMIAKDSSVISFFLFFPFKKKNLERCQRKEHPDSKSTPKKHCKLPSVSCAIVLSSKWKRHVRDGLMSTSINVTSSPHINRTKGDLKMCANFKINNLNKRNHTHEISRNGPSSHLKINRDINFNRLTATTINEVDF